VSPTITLLAQYILSQRQQLTVTRIIITDLPIRRGFNVAAAFQNTKLLQVLTEIVGMAYPVCGAELISEPANMDVTLLDSTILSYK
jgi:hypothetical protein